LIPASFHFIQHGISSYQSRHEETGFTAAR
jgi:hypothetical protein